MRLVGSSPFLGGLCGGSFPAPHYHDPNKTLLNFQIWVMVVFHSPITAGKRLRDQRFFRAGVRLRYQRLQTLRRPCYRLLRHRSVLGPEFRRDHRASGPSWPLMAEIGHYLESIIPPTVHLVLLAVFMEVSPFFTIWLAVLRVSFWWVVWYFEAAWWRCRVCIGWILVAESDVYLVAHWYVFRRSRCSSQSRVTFSSTSSTSTWFDQATKSPARR